ncbi:membrane protein [Streptomyces xiaopingdaonensis]|uniref:membrane protein n=1 Tax=Streptomyces xiaopingdaonensis TaxID=1565415 RepID=UPI0002E06BCC|nr:membrane protein [Streptomyces xiaopingdaonensis]
MSVVVRAAGVACAVVVAAPSVAVADGVDGFTIKDPRITESSGLAASRAHKGVYWTHNDSAHSPLVYAVDGRTGRTVATVTLQGVEMRDVEAISVGTDGNVYVGDIGDNRDGTWPEVWIYRFSEPKELGDTTLTPTRYTVRYDDGPRDAESMMVHPKTGRVYIASKSNAGKGGLYAGPEELSPQGVNTFERVKDIDLWATDGAFSPDGTRLVLRGYFTGEMYAWRGGKAELLGSVPVPIQRQGESVTFTLDGRTLLLGSEGENSSVEPVELDGKLLPESAAKEKESGKPSEGGAGDGSGSDEEGSDKTVVGAGVFVAAVFAWLGLRRLFRRRD